MDGLEGAIRGAMQRLRWWSGEVVVVDGDEDDHMGTVFLSGERGKERTEGLAMGER